MANANGWGDGSVNNNIGWGQAPNNNISWGKSQITSWSGATDIDGGNTPVNTVAPAITGTAQEGQTLTCSTGTWSGSPTYAYQWKRNGSNIGSATNSTYVLVTADVGQSIKCTVTATNFIGSATADSNTVTPTSSVDADAQAFITAASITDPTQQAAINTLVVDLKGYNIWTKFKAIYPIVGGVASAHAVNLKTPGTFNLTFASGWTHSSTGMTPTNAYADTFFNPNSGFSVNDDVHLSYYSRTNSNGTEIEIGSATTVGGPYLILEIRTSGTTYYIMNSSGSYATASDSDSRAFYIGNRIGTAEKGFRNNTNVISRTSTATPRPNFNTYLGAFNAGGTASTYTTKQCAFASIGDGLTDTDATNLYTVVNAYQVALSRNV